ncbi:M17 family metallopeptidase [Mesomycoplasma lagogenitalium]|uniref:Probable cytosol aminopeptidase n=1 Tax=Mesomycoplasma lagogenitalium TaxID=171286 RepID=A0ABY8LU62_9BACT|nr:M17 family metallopeptidase [Mesomycoplasma lagogenitalium]WGI36769.1 M17 family metallopeptidase [Mesomycoplasma lagogenitalium]
MLNFLEKHLNENIILEAVFKGDNLPEYTVEKNFYITEFLNNKKAVIYLGEKDKFKKESLNSLIDVLISLSRTYELNLSSFLVNDITATFFVNKLVEKYEFKNAKLYNVKTDKKEEENNLFVVYNNLKELDSEIKKVKVLADAVNFARNLQVTPPNVCNSEWLAEEVKKEVGKDSNLKVNVLTKKEIEKLNMGLLLSVNKGSMYEPRLVSIEYIGNPNSKEKTVFVGKGITFDSGGYNIKTGRYMVGMKFDMSGAAIVASALKAISQLNPKANVGAVLAITDNRVNGDANLPDAVWKSMNGKTVEINNTDAEGRLVLADGMTYAIRNLNATRVITVATLTGAILVALGQTYTGAFSTSDNLWKEIEVAAKETDELVWRLPLHDDFAKFIKKSVVADLKNTDFTGNGGSISAAMFLKEFAENAEFAHLDIAGTAEISDKPMGVMVKTLVQLALNKK